MILNGICTETRGYNSSLKSALESGVSFDGTLASFDHRIVIEFPETVFGRPMFLPANRGSLRTSKKYALNESIWYMMKTRDPQFIIDKGGKTWDRMRDSEGLVNSNYGYQIFENNDLQKKAFDLVRNGRCSLMIATPDNAKMLSDTVCNNLIEIILDSGMKTAQVEVFTRSLDLVYGLPYDLFAVQGFVYKVLSIAKLVSTRISQVSFNVINCHIYERDVKRFDDVDLSQHDVFYVTSFEQSPYDKLSIPNDYQVSWIDVMNEMPQSCRRELSKIKLIEDDDLPCYGVSSDEFCRMMKILEDNPESRKAMSVSSDTDVATLIWMTNVLKVSSSGERSLQRRVYLYRSNL